MYDEFSTPAVVLEMNTIEKNIREMVENNKKYNIAHRPHIKPHKSIELAKLQLKLGSKGITCAKLGEAEVMAAGGIDDILLAFPVIGEDKLIRYGKLAEKCTIRTIVNSCEGALGLSQLGRKLCKKLEILIEMDGGINRGGVKPFEPTLEFAKQIDNLEGIKIVGLMYYGGTIYSEKTQEGIDRVTKEEHDALVKTAELLEKNGFSMNILSGGSSYSGKSPKYLEGITEVRAGNYIFNDCNQLTINKVGPSDCALRVVATVVSRPDEYSAIIDAGSKALTTDTCQYRAGYGYVIGHEDITIYKLNEEHGFLKSEKPIDLKIGDKIAIIPNHACVIANLVEEVYGLRNGKFDRMIKIDARGKNV